jgi:hypothetical protein
VSPKRPDHEVEKLTNQVARSMRDPAYFISQFIQIQSSDESGSDWVPFKLWKPAQTEVLNTIHTEKQVIILKARQLGLTWLVLAYAVWMAVTRPNSLILLYSLTEEDVKKLMKMRLYEMWQRLPDWVRGDPYCTGISDDQFSLSNGSRILGLSANRGAGYTANLVIVDEADVIDRDVDGRLAKLLLSAKPTIESAAGKIVLCSTAVKSRPNSHYKKLWNSGSRHEGGWSAVFLPWDAHPGRSKRWYEKRKAETLAELGSVDELFENYPSTAAECLAPRSIDKRINPELLVKVYKPKSGPCAPSVRKRSHDGKTLPALPGSKIFVGAAEGLKYVIGVDPAEGNPNSDPSVAEVLEAVTGEEVAVVACKAEPAVFASYVALLSEWYNNAAVMVERNNHGHAVLQWLRDNAPSVQRLHGLDGKLGWLSNSIGKSTMYTELARAVSQQDITIVSLETFQEVTSIEAGTLKAPRGAHDDRATALALANMARGKIVVNYSITPITIERPKRDLFGLRESEGRSFFNPSNPNVIYRPSRNRPFGLR